MAHGARRSALSAWRFADCLLIPDSITQQLNRLKRLNGLNSLNG